MRLVPVVALTVLAALPFAPAQAGDKPEKPSAPVSLEPTEEQLQTINTALDKAAADKDDELFARCLIDMEQLKHDSFKDHIKKGLKSKKDFVKVPAILAAANHGMKDEAKNLVKLLKKKPKKKKKKRKKGAMTASSSVQVAVIHYLARMGIKGHGKAVFEHFKRLFVNPETGEGPAKAGLGSQANIDKLKAVCHYLGVDKYKPCVKAVIDQIPEPKPANVNSGSNPPASYWEGRFKLWQANEGHLRWVLKEITGKEYRSHREWKAWYANNEKEYGEK